MCKICVGTEGKQSKILEEKTIGGLGDTFHIANKSHTTLRLNSLILEKQDILDNLDIEVWTICISVNYWKYNNLECVIKIM